MYTHVYMEYEQKERLNGILFFNIYDLVLRLE